MPRFAKWCAPDRSRAIPFPRLRNRGPRIPQRDQARRRADSSARRRGWLSTLPNSALLKFALRRTGQALLVFLVATFLTYIALFELGDPFASIGERAMPPRTKAILHETFGLDEPLPVQYLTFLGNLFTGDLGIDFDARRPVADLLAATIPNTVRLALLTMALELLIGITAGVLAAVRRASFWDMLVTVGTIVLMSIPVLVTASFLRDKVSGLQLGGVTVFPNLPLAFGHEPHWISLIALPALAMAGASSAFTARLIRTSMLEVLESDYVRTARAKGLPQRTVVFKHALRNAVIPSANLATIQIGALFGGALVVETIFQYPGVGFLFVRALRSLNTPVLIATFSYTVVAFVVLIALLDILCAYLDPRLRID
jgi:oligopeptide transport system permease protein